LNINAMDTGAWLEICQQCITACETAANTVMDLDLIEEMPGYTQICWQCADACTMASRFVANHSPLAREVWQACAEACELALFESEQYDYDFCEAVRAACANCLTLSEQAMK